VILYDVYLSPGDVFYERDHTCPFLCEKHMLENERNAKTFPEGPAGGFELVNLKEALEQVDEFVDAGSIRKYRGAVRYPYTNRHFAQGFSIYRPLTE
jgi:hypothetical protein